MKEVNPHQYLEDVKDGKFTVDVDGLDGSKEFPADKVIPLTIGFEIQSTRYRVKCHIGARMVSAIR